MQPFPEKFTPVGRFLDLLDLCSVRPSLPSLSDEGHFEPGLLNDSLGRALLGHVPQGEKVD